MKIVFIRQFDVFYHVTYDAENQSEAPDSQELQVNDVIHNVTGSLARIVQFGLPLIIVVISATVLILTRTPPETPARAMLPLRVTTGVTAAVWLFYYAEILSQTRFPLLDLGAPAMLLLALLVLPVLAVLVWRGRKELASVPRRRLLFTLASLLIVLTLLPSVLLVLFYVAAA